MNCPHILEALQTPARTPAIAQSRSDVNRDKPTTAAYCNPATLGHITYISMKQVLPQAQTGPVKHGYNVITNNKSQTATSKPLTNNDED